MVKENVLIVGRTFMCEESYAAADTIWRTDTTICSQFCEAHRFVGGYTETSQPFLDQTPGGHLYRRNLAVVFHSEAAFSPCSARDKSLCDFW